MSLVKTCCITCDHPHGCTAYITGGNGTAARYRARQLGWRIGPKTDLCPEHRPNTRAARASRKDT